ncbi:MAG: hypothetical protein WCO02_07180 [Bacteroidota bacterium]
MQDAGCKMQDAGCKMQDEGCGMQDAENRDSAKHYIQHSIFDIIHEIVYFNGVHYGFAEQYSIFHIRHSFLQSFIPSVL